MRNAQERWSATWNKLGLPAPDRQQFESLVAHYSEAHRKYHTLRHLDECFAKLEELQSEVVYRGETEIALWFHDAIYDVRAHDNEEKSAAWASACLRAAGAPETIEQRVRTLIMATANHQAAEDPDAKILVDVDLSILAATPARFQEYEQQIREEYRHVPDAVFAHHRRLVLEGFLKRPEIFNTKAFFDCYEQQARNNLVASLQGSMLP